MCEIDWGALGTWVASFIALGIAVEDKVVRRIRLRSERVALAAIIRADLDLVRFHLHQLFEEIGAKLQGEVRGISDVLLYESQQNRDDVVRRGSFLDVPAIRAGADRLYIFEVETAKALAEVVTSVRALKTGCGAMSDPLPTEDTFSEYVDALRDNAIETLEKVDVAIQRLSTHA